MADDLVKDSKFLSLILRHEPGKIGLALGEGGWVDVEELLAKLAAAGKRIDRARLEHLVATSDKKRFTLSEDGSRIRAAQGHSVEVDLALSPAIPPETLYHGTADRFLISIRATGLTKQSRQHVHLSADAETATRVGQRHGRVAVLTVSSGEMHRAGHAFWRADNGVWLTEAVPPHFLREG